MKKRKKVRRSNPKEEAEARRGPGEPVSAYLKKFSMKMKTYLRKFAMVLKTLMKVKIYSM